MIDLTRPIPCVKYKPYNGEEQMCHIGQELIEAVEAYNANDREHTAEELTDVIVACTTMMEWLGYDEKARVRMQKTVNEKNRARGYW